MKKVLITGASGGLGSAVAKRFKQEGYRLFLHSHKSREGFLNADLSKENEVKKLLKKTGRNIDIFIHSVSAPIENKLIEEKSWADFESHLDLQLKAFFLIAKSIFPHMKTKKWGRIIPIATEYTEGAPPTHISDYVTAKYAMWGFAKCIAVEYGKFGITCNAVSPGTMETNLTAKLPKKLKEIIAAGYQSGTLVQPDAVAEKITFLCSEKAKDINGENIIIT